MFNRRKIITIITDITKITDVDGGGTDGDEGVINQARTDDVL